MTNRSRAPEAFDLDDPHLAIEPEIVLDETEEALPALIATKRRAVPWGRLFWGGLAGLVSLGIGLWADTLIRNLFARAEALGWVGVGLAAMVLAAFLAIAGREVAGLLRLRRIHTLRDLATEAHTTDAPGIGRRLGARILDLYADRPETAAGRNALERELREIVDGRDIVALAERDVLGPLDQAAQALVLASAKRVSVVTAASPRALIDLAFVGWEALRLARRVATLYGGRPGTLGLLALVREIVAHLIVTGGLAVGDGVLAGVLGHGLAGRISARLGEGVVNGVLTARVGVATMSVCRPMPFLTARPPSIRDIAARLVTRGDGKRPVEAS